MIVRNISLDNVRNFSHADITLSDGVNIIYGDNAQGKTNFLESLYFCATGRTYRCRTDKEMIKFGETEAFLRVVVENGKIKDKINCAVRNSGKFISLNGIAVKKLSELFGVLYTVSFSPEDLNLVKAGPSDRRRFVDMELCQTDSVYYHEISKYYRALKQRNALLKILQKKNEERELIFVWDEQLAKHIKGIYNARKTFLEKIGEYARLAYSSMTAGKETLQIVYKPNIMPDDFPDRLTKDIERDIFLGTTNRGIHKDEFVFLINGQDARIYGSQGQQRLAALSVKLAEISLIQEEKQESPVLLLDDVFSELDEHRQRRLVEKINSSQTILTCALSGGVVKTFNNACIFRVRSGEIKKE